MSVDVAKGMLESITSTISPEEGSIFYRYGWLALAILGISICTPTYYSISKLVGSKNNYIDVQPQIDTIWIYTFPAGVALFLSALLYFREDRSGIVYFIFVMTCISFSLSFSAMALSTVTKV